MSNRARVPLNTEYMNKPCDSREIQYSTVVRTSVVVGPYDIINEIFTDTTWV